MKSIYLDYAAATPVDPAVRKAMEPYFSEKYGNPSSVNTTGLDARKAVDAAREQVASLIGAARPGEVIFTAGGTESINLALKGMAFSKKSGHLIATHTEHSAVLETCAFLQKQGYAVTYLPVDSYGAVDAADVKKAIRSDTVLISVIYANNEIGTINPIAAIGRIAQKHGIPLHTDACQAGGLLDINVARLGVDLMTLNGSKMYGPKGSGILYVRSGLRLSPLVHGGGQEYGLRAGTENVPAIVGFARALELAGERKDKEAARLAALRDRLAARLLAAIPDSRLNGHPTNRLPNNVSISFRNVDGDVLLLYLNDHRISASTGSACEAKVKTSHVLRAIGLRPDYSNGTIRFSLGLQTTPADTGRLIRILPAIVSQLRSTRSSARRAGLR